MTGLRSVGRGNFDHASLSFFRFSHQCIKERRPCCIRDTFVEPRFLAGTVGQIRARCLLPFRLWSFDHAAHDQGFDRNQPVTVHQSSRHLLHEVLSAPANTLMHAGDCLASPHSLWGANRCPAKSALCMDQGLLLSVEKPGIIDGRAIGKVGKGFETHINADLRLGGGQANWGDFIASKAHEPFACRAAGDRAGLDDASHGPVLHQLEMPNLGQGELALLIDAKT